MIQDGVERGIIERARSGGLSRPRLGTSIIDVDRIRVLCISVQDVDGVEELGEVASRVCTVERTIIRVSSRVFVIWGRVILTDGQWQ